MMQFLLLAGLVGSALLDDRGSLAPDGARGFGQGIEPAAVLSLLRSSRDADRAFLAELADLPARVQLAVDDLERPYRQLGYFALVDELEGPRVVDLHTAFADALRDPAAALATPAAQATAFAAMLVDVRFRVRLDLIGAARAESQHLPAALAVLEAAARGGADLPSSTIVALARLADVAASRLRALEKDLIALRRAISGSAGAGQRVRELVESAGEASNDARTLAATLEDIERRRRTMARALFSTRLDETLAFELRWRERATERARRLVDQARELVPEIDGDPAGKKPAGDRTKRLRRALSLALEGLEFDPLHEQLTWIAAESNDLVGGGADARSFFERFLALRGIRSWDDKSYRGRDLTAREERALWVVQGTPGMPR